MSKRRSRSETRPPGCGRPRGAARQEHPSVLRTLPDSNALDQPRLARCATLRSIHRNGPRNSSRSQLPSNPRRAPVLGRSKVEPSERTTTLANGYSLKHRPRPLHLVHPVHPAEIFSRRRGARPRARRPTKPMPGTLLAFRAEGPCFKSPGWSAKRALSLRHVGPPIPNSSIRGSVGRSGFRLWARLRCSGRRHRSSTGCFQPSIVAMLMTARSQTLHSGPGMGRE